MIKELEKIGKISENDLVFVDMDRIFTKLTLDDYDWMNYRLACSFPLKTGILEVEFEYIGAAFSYVKVKDKQYEFGTDIFTKYLDIW